MKTRSSLPFFCALLWALTACYGSAPPRPAPIPLPELRSGAQIAVESETKTTIENVAKESFTCPQGHTTGSQACVRTTYTVAEPVTRTTTRASYGSQPINYAQFVVLTDPDRDAKLAELDDHRRACRLANIPRWTGAALLLGGVASMFFDPWNNAGAKAVFYTGFIGGTASYTAGYYVFGGQRCNEAERLYHQLELSDEQAIEVVHGEQHAVEMKEISARFNERASLSQR